MTAPTSISSIAERLRALADELDDPQGHILQQPLLVHAIDMNSASDIRAWIQRRRLRDRFFGAGWFKDAAWEMLLDLYAAWLEDEQVSVSSLCIAASGSSTGAALRMQQRMEGRLIVRTPDRYDRRRVFVELHPFARVAMQQYIGAIGRERSS